MGALHLEDNLVLNGHLLVDQAHVYLNGFTLNATKITFSNAVVVEGSIISDNATLIGTSAYGYGTFTAKTMRINSSFFASYFPIYVETLKQLNGGSRVEVHVAHHLDIDAENSPPTKNTTLVLEENSTPLNCNFNKSFKYLIVREAFNCALEISEGQTVTFDNVIQKKSISLISGTIFLNNSIVSDTLQLSSSTAYFSGDCVIGTLLLPTDVRFRQYSPYANVTILYEYNTYDSARAIGPLTHFSILTSAKIVPNSKFTSETFYIKELHANTSGSIHVRGILTAELIWGSQKAASTFIILGNGVRCDNLHTYGNIDFYTNIVSITSLIVRGEFLFRSASVSLTNLSIFESGKIEMETSILRVSGNIIVNTTQTYFLLTSASSTFSGLIAMNFIEFSGTITNEGSESTTMSLGQYTSAIIQSWSPNLGYIVASSTSIIYSKDHIKWIDISSSAVQLMEPPNCTPEGAFLLVISGESCTVQTMGTMIYTETGSTVEAKLVDYITVLGFGTLKAGEDKKLETIHGYNDLERPFSTLTGIFGGELQFKDSTIIKLTAFQFIGFDTRVSCSGDCTLFFLSDLDSMFCPKNSSGLFDLHIIGKSRSRIAVTHSFIGVLHVQRYFIHLVFTDSSDDVQIYVTADVIDSMKIHTTYESYLGFRNAITVFDLSAFTDIEKSSMNFKLTNSFTLKADLFSVEFFIENDAYVGLNSLCTDCSITGSITDGIFYVLSDGDANLLLYPNNFRAIVYGSITLRYDNDAEFHIFGNINLAKEDTLNDIKVFYYPGCTRTDLKIASILNEYYLSNVGVVKGFASNIITFNSNMHLRKVVFGEFPSGTLTFTGASHYYCVEFISSESIKCQNLKLHSVTSDTAFKSNYPVAIGGTAKIKGGSVIGSDGAKLVVTDYAKFNSFNCASCWIDIAANSAYTKTYLEYSVIVSCLHHTFRGSYTIEFSSCQTLDFGFIEVYTGASIVLKNEDNCISGGAVDHFFIQEGGLFIPDNSIDLAPNLIVTIFDGAIIHLTKSSVSLVSSNVARDVTIVLYMQTSLNVMIHGGDLRLVCAEGLDCNSNGDIAFSIQSKDSVILISDVPLSIIGYVLETDNKPSLSITGNIKNAPLNSHIFCELPSNIGFEDLNSNSATVDCVDNTLIIYGSHAVDVIARNATIYSPDCDIKTLTSYNSTITAKKVSLVDATGNLNVSTDEIGDITSTFFNLITSNDVTLLSGLKYSNTNFNITCTRQSMCHFPVSENSVITSSTIKGNNFVHFHGHNINVLDSSILIHMNVSGSSTLNGNFSNIMMYGEVEFNATIDKLWLLNSAVAKGDIHSNSVMMWAGSSMKDCSLNTGSLSKANRTKIECEYYSVDFFSDIDIVLDSGISNVDLIPNMESINSLTPNYKKNPTPVFSIDDSNVYSPDRSFRKKRGTYYHDVTINRQRRLMYRFWGNDSAILDIDDAHVFLHDVEVSIARLSETVSVRMAFDFIGILQATETYIFLDEDLVVNGSIICNGCKMFLNGFTMTISDSLRVNNANDGGVSNGFIVVETFEVRSTFRVSTTEITCTSFIVSGGEVYIEPTSFIDTEKATLNQPYFDGTVYIRASVVLTSPPIQSLSQNSTLAFRSPSLYDEIDFPSLCTVFKNIRIQGEAPIEGDLSCFSKVHLLNSTKSAVIASFARIKVCASKLTLIEGGKLIIVDYAATVSVEELVFDGINTHMVAIHPNMLKFNVDRLIVNANTILGFFNRIILHEMDINNESTLEIRSVDIILGTVRGSGLVYSISPVTVLKDVISTGLLSFDIPVSLSETTTTTYGNVQFLSPISTEFLICYDGHVQFKDTSDFDDVELHNSTFGFGIPNSIEFTVITFHTLSTLKMYIDDSQHQSYLFKIEGKVFLELSNIIEWSNSHESNNVLFIKSTIPSVILLKYTLESNGILVYDTLPNSIIYRISVETVSFTETKQLECVQDITFTFEEQEWKMLCSHSGSLENRMRYFVPSYREITMNIFINTLTVVGSGQLSTYFSTITDTYLSFTLNGVIAGGFKNTHKMSLHHHDPLHPYLKVHSMRNIIELKHFNFMNQPNVLISFCTTLITADVVEFSNHNEEQATVIMRSTTQLQTDLTFYKTNIHFIASFATFSTFTSASEPVNTIIITGNYIKLDSISVDMNTDSVVLFKKMCFKNSAEMIPEYISMLDCLVQTGETVDVQTDKMNQVDFISRGTVSISKYSNLRNVTFFASKKFVVTTNDKPTQGHVHFNIEPYGGLVIDPTSFCEYLTFDIYTGASLQIKGPVIAITDDDVLAHLFNNLDTVRIMETISDIDLTFIKHAITISTESTGALRSIVLPSDTLSVTVTQITSNYRLDIPGGYLNSFHWIGSSSKTYPVDLRADSSFTESPAFYASTSRKNCARITRSTSSGEFQSNHMYQHFKEENQQLVAYSTISGTSKKAICDDNYVFYLENIIFTHIRHENCNGMFFILKNAEMRDNYFLFPYVSAFAGSKINLPSYTVFTSTGMRLPFAHPHSYLKQYQQSENDMFIYQMSTMSLWGARIELNRLTINVDSPPISLGFQLLGNELQINCTGCNLHLAFPSEIVRDLGDYSQLVLGTIIEGIVPDYYDNTLFLYETTLVNMDTYMFDGIQTPASHSFISNAEISHALDMYLTCDTCSIISSSVSGTITGTTSLDQTTFIGLGEDATITALDSTVTAHIRNSEIFGSTYNATCDDCSGTASGTFNITSSVSNIVLDGDIRILTYCGENDCTVSGTVVVSGGGKVNVCGDSLIHIESNTVINSSTDELITVMQHSGSLTLENTKSLRFYGPFDSIFQNVTYKSPVLISTDLESINSESYVFLSQDISPVEMIGSGVLFGHIDGNVSVLLSQKELTENDMMFAFPHAFLPVNETDSYGYFRTSMMTGISLSNCSRVSFSRTGTFVVFCNFTTKQKYFLDSFNFAINDACGSYQMIPISFVDNVFKQFEFEFTIGKFLHKPSFGYVEAISGEYTQLISISVGPITLQNTANIVDKGDEVTIYGTNIINDDECFEYTGSFFGNVHQLTVTSSSLTLVLPPFYGWNHSVTVFDFGIEMGIFCCVSAVEPVLTSVTLSESEIRLGGSFLDLSDFSSGDFTVSLSEHTFSSSSNDVTWTPSLISLHSALTLFCALDEVHVTINYNGYIYDLGSVTLRNPRIISSLSVNFNHLPSIAAFALDLSYNPMCDIFVSYSHDYHVLHHHMSPNGTILNFAINNLVSDLHVSVFQRVLQISPPAPTVVSVSPVLLPTVGGVVEYIGDYLGDSLFPHFTVDRSSFGTIHFVSRKRVTVLVPEGTGAVLPIDMNTSGRSWNAEALSYLPPVLYPPVIGACYTSLRVPLIGANFGPAGTEATARFTYNDWTPSIPVFVLGHRSALAILPPGPDDLCSNPALLETADIRFDVSVGGQTSYSIPAQYSVFPSVEPNNVPCARFASSVTLRVDMSSTGMIPEPRIRLSSDIHISVHTCALDGYLLTCVVPGLVSAEYTGSVQIAGHSEWIALSGRVYAFDVPNQRFIIPIGQEHPVSVKLSHVHTSAIGVSYDGNAMITNTTDEGVAFAHAFSQSGSGIVVTVGDFSVEPSIVFDAVSVDPQTFYMPYGAPYRVSVAATGLHMCRSLVVQVQGIVFLGSFNGATLESDVHVLKTGWSSMHAFCDDVQLYVGEARVFTLDASEIHAFDDAPFSATLCGIGLPPLSLGVCASEACGDCWCFVECVTESLALDPIGIDIPLTRVARPEFSQILWPYGVDHQAKLEPKNPIHSSVSFAMENITFAPSDLALLLGGALYGNTSMRVATPASSYSLSPVTVIKPLLGAILPKKLSMLEDKVIKLTGIHLTEFEGYVLRARYKTTTVYCQLRAGLEFECPFIDPGMYTMDLSTTGGRLFSNGLELQVELPRSELCDTANIPETSRLFELVMNIPRVVALNVALDDARLTDGQRCDVGWSELRREVVDIDREAFVTAISVVLYEPCDVSMVARTANETWVFEPADIVCEQFSSGIMYHELCIMFFDHVRASSFDIELVGCSAVTEVELFGHYVDQVVDLRVVGPMSASIDASSVPLAVAPLNILGRQLAVDQGVLVDGSFVPVANQQLLLSVPKKHGLQCVTVAYSGASTKFCILILAGQAESCAVLTIDSQLVPNTSVPFNVECTDAYGGAASSAVAVECDAGCSFEDSTLILAEPARSNNVTVSSGRFTAITELELMPVPYAAQFFVVRSGIGQPLEIEAHLTDYTDQPVADVGDVAVSTDGVLLHEDSWEAHMGIAIVTTPILNIPLGSNVTVAITANSTKATFELTISDMECPAHSMFVGDACVCSPGYTRRDDVCSACPVGEFKTAEGDVPCASCPSTMISPIAAVSPLQCQCADNYRLVESTCVQCHETVSCANNTISSAIPNHFLEPQATVALTCPSLECDGATCVSARGFMCSMCPNGESIGYDLECTGTKWTPLFHHLLATLLLAVLAFAFDTATIAAVGAAALTLPFFGLRFYAINILTLKTPIIVPVAGLVIAYVLLYFAPSRMRSMSTFLVCHMAVALAARTPSLMSTSLSLSLLSPSLFAYAALAATSTHTYLMLRRAKHQVDFTPVIITASVLLLSLVCGTHIVVFGFAAFVTAVLVGLHFFIKEH
ncbi:hypothetical protein PCE1_001996 [Barthelona sp. PCE]